MTTEPATQSPVAVGDVLLGKYRVERVLGQGGMGVVVAARHLELGELFAIKFLLPAALVHPQAVERFVREARASARLKGEHVAKVQDVGRTPDGLPYMILEYLAGKDLKDTVQERGPLPVQEAATYVLQACEAVAEAHGLNIVHRDIKPANLFLTRRPNGSPCVKVLDFGISKQLDPERPEQHGLTKTGMLLGSPYYMSPEQMMRTKEADPRSDIWSLGCVLYELLTGRVPFQADALTELVGLVLQEEPKPPSFFRPDLGPAVEAVVLRCLVKKKEQRYQTVQELAAALREAAWATSGQQPLAHAATALAPRGSTPGLAPQLPPIGETQELPAVPPRASSSGVRTGEAGGGTVGLPGSAGDVSTVPLTASPVAAVTGAAPQTTAPGWGTTAHELAPKRRVSGPILAGAGIGLVALLGGGVFFATREEPKPAARAAPTATSEAAPVPTVAPAPISTDDPKPAVAPPPVDSGAEPKKAAAPDPKPPKEASKGPAKEPNKEAPKDTVKPPSVPSVKATTAPAETKPRETMY